MQESEQESTVNGLDSGLNTSDSFAQYDHESSSWKTSQLCLHGGLIEFSETWPKAGMMRNGSAYVRPTLERRTDGNGCSLWPTPTQADSDGRTIRMKSTDPLFKETGRHALSLDRAVQRWPTPRASDAERGGRGELLHIAKGATTPMGPLWPTPMASDAVKWSNQSKAEREAKGQMVRLPTAVSPQGGAGGQLNPMFVEWLMGFPANWTEV
jgi:hypothetical protein